MADGKQLSADDLERLVRDKDSALRETENLRSQLENHSSRARLLADELQRTKDDRDAERAAHADSRAKVGSLQDRVGVIPELERKYAEAVSDVDRLRSETSQWKLSAAKLERELETKTDALSISETKRKQAEKKLGVYDKLAQGLTALHLAQEVVATESARLRG